MNPSEMICSGMKNLVMLLFILTGSLTPGISQYISGITIPDTTKVPVTDSNDLAFRLASGISPSTLRDHMTILASDSLEGRETGQKGLDMAAEYIRRNIRSMGLYSKQDMKIISRK